MRFDTPGDERGDKTNATAEAMHAGAVSPKAPAASSPMTAAVALAMAQGAAGAKAAEAPKDTEDLQQPQHEHPQPQQLQQPQKQQKKHKNEQPQQQTQQRQEEVKEVCSERPQQEVPQKCSIEKDTIDFSKTTETKLQTKMVQLGLELQPSAQHREEGGVAVESKFMEVQPRIEQQAPIAQRSDRAEVAVGAAAFRHLPSVGSWLCPSRPALALTASIAGAVPAQESPAAVVAPEGEQVEQPQRQLVQWQPALHQLPSVGTWYYRKVALQPAMVFTGERVAEEAPISCKGQEGNFVVAEREQQVVKKEAEVDSEFQLTLPVKVAFLPDVEDPFIAGKLSWATKPSVGTWASLSMVVASNAKF